MKVLVAGDLCPQYRVAEKFDKNDFESVFGEVKTILSKVDYSIVNFECPVTNGNEEPIIKKGPHLQCTDKGIEAVKWVDFKGVTLANNHFLDYGREGVRNTLEACKKRGLDTVGGGLNIREASSILYKEIENQKLAIINCCEHEFSIATDGSAGSNPLNAIHQFYDIQEAKRKANYILVIVHGGHEYCQLPSIRMQDTYRFFIDAGADAVINHHQHCFSGFETYKGHPIFYGIGNFLFDKKDVKSNLWNEGFMVELEFEPAKMQYQLHPYIQCKESSTLKLMPKDYYEERLNNLNNIISNREKLKDALESYYRKNTNKLRLIFEPIRNRFVLGAQKRGWLPSLITHRQKLLLENNILCESHRDKLIYFFNSEKND